MNKLYIYTDGGARGNPGSAGIGIVISEKKIEENENGIIKKYSEYIGEMTNNEAEYQALVFALRKAKGIFKKVGINKGNAECFLDSELIVKQLNHEYKIKDENLAKFFITIWNLTLDFEKITFSHITREKNREADKLVNEALDRKEKEKTLPRM